MSTATQIINTRNNDQTAAANIFSESIHTLVRIPDSRGVH
jgi:hypothetical protein